MADDLDTDTDTDDISDLQDQQDEAQLEPGPSQAPAQAIPTAQPAAFTPQGGRGGVYKPPGHALAPAAPSIPAGGFDFGSDDDDAKPTAKPGAKVTWGDLGKSAWTNVLGMGKDLAGAAAAVTQQITSDPQTNAYVNSWRDSFNQHIDDTVKDMTPQGQAAFKASIMNYATGQGQTPSDVGIKNYAEMNLANIVPTVIAAILPASITAKVVTKGLAAMGATTELASGAITASRLAANAGGVAGTGMTATLFGAQNAGAVYGEIHDYIGDASDQTLQKEAPVYAQLRAQGMSVDDAKAAYTKQSAWAVAAGFGVGAVAGIGIGGKLVPKGLGVLGRAGAGAAEGAATMGAQGGADTALVEKAEGKPVDLPSVMASAASAGVTGLALGAAGGVIHRGEAPKAAEQKPGVKEPATDPTLVAAAGDQLTEPDDPDGGGSAGAMAAAAPVPPPGPATAPDISGVPGYSPPNEPPRVYPTTPLMRPPATPEGEPTGVPGYSPPIGTSQPLPGEAAMAQMRAAETRPPSGPVQPPAVQPPAVQVPPEARPSQGMKRADLVDALQTYGESKQTLNRMKAGDLAALFDRHAQTTTPGAPAPGLTPEGAATTVVKGSAGSAAQPPAPLLPHESEAAAPSATPARAAPPSAAPEAAARELPQGVQRAPPGLQALIDKGVVTPGVTARELVGLQTKPTPEATARAVAASKRALAKARMAEPVGERMRGRVETLGEEPGETSGISPIEEVRREEQARGGAEARSAEAIEERATGGGEGESAGQTMGLEIRNKQITVATDRTRIAGDYIEKVLDPSDPMDVHEAAAAYDKRTNRQGRPRREGYNTFADALDTEIKHVEESGQGEKLHEQLVKNANTMPRDEDHADALETKARELVGKLQRYDPERVQQLKTERAKLVDPVGEEVRAQRQAELEATMREELGGAGIPEDAPVSSGISPRSSRYVTGSADQRLGTNYERLVRDHDERGVPLMAHEAATFIAQDPMIRAEQEPLREVAARFARILPHDVPVMSIGQAFDEGRISQARHDDLLDRNVYGAYDPKSRTILHNLDAERLTGTHVETALHEMSHAISYHYLNALRRADPNHTDLQALHAIRQELADHLASEAKSGNLSPAEVDRLSKAVSNLDELHTQLFTDPVVQGFAAARQASPALLDTLRSLRHPTAPGQSIWRSFANWVRKAVGQPPARSASEHTLFDHIIKPAADIQARAVEYNKRYLPQDPVLRSAAEPVYDGASSALSERMRNLSDYVDAPGIGDKLRRGLLAATTSDAMVSRYGHELPEMHEWRAGYEGIARSSKEFSDANADKVNTLNKQMTRLPDRKNLENLMTDATIGRAHLGEGLPGDANDHLTTPQEQSNLSKLQGRYDALSPAAKEVYAGYRDLYAKWFKDQRAAELSDLTRRVNSDPALTAGIAKVFAHGEVQGDYFPLRRFGDYIVRSGDRDDPENYSVQHFESRSAAQAEHDRLKAAGENPYPVVSRRASDLRDIAPHSPIVDELTNSLAAKGFPEGEVNDIKEAFNRILLEHASRNEAARARMARRNVRGASTDQARILANEFINTQARMGVLAHGLDRARGLTAMREHVDQISRDPDAPQGQQIRLASVVREAEKRSTEIDQDHVLTSAMAKINSLSYAQTVMSVSHMVTSSLEAHSNSVSFLGARHGVVQSTLALARALKQASPVLGKGAINTIRAVGGELKANDWNLSKVIQARMIRNGTSVVGMTKLFSRLEDAGLIDHTALMDIRRQANAQGAATSKAGDLWRRFQDFNAASAHATDVMNRSAIAKAAFDLEYRKTGNVDQAVDYAVQMTRQSMPNYNVGNKARIATSRGILGPLGAPLTQFKNYGIHELSVLANLAKDSWSGPNKWEARRAFAGVLATRMMMAGVLTTIADPLRYIGGAYDLLFTDRTKPHNYQNDVRAWMSSDDVFGKELGELLARGLPHRLGIDIHNRVGLANLLEIPEMSSFDKDGAMQVLFGLATGATGENLRNLVDGVNKMRQGDIMGGLKEGIEPRPIRDLMKGIGLADQGVTDSKGKTILAPGRLPPSAPIVQALGFQPADVSEFREGRNAELEAREEATSERDRLSKEWLAADQGERQNIWQQIVAHNQDPKTQGYKITMTQLLKDQEAQRKQARSPFGVRLPAKALHAPGGPATAGSFANYGNAAAQPGAP